MCIIYTSYIFHSQVHTWGCNDEGALGRHTATEEDAFTSGVVDLDAKVVQISTGDCHTAALTDEGKVFIWGCFRVSRELVDGKTYSARECLPQAGERNEEIDLFMIWPNIFFYQLN